MNQYKESMQGINTMNQYNAPIQRTNERMSKHICYAMLYAICYAKCFAICYMLYAICYAMLCYTLFYVLCYMLYAILSDSGSNRAHAVTLVPFS